MSEKISLSPNKLVQFLKKPADSFTKKDIVKFIENNGIKMLNFRYIGGDGRLKTLNFVINSEEHLNNVLTYGERVDGSSLFSFIEARSSDLYVVPKYRTAFVNPFTEIPTLDIMCTYFTNEGKPLESAPENLVKNAQKVLFDRTGYKLEALGELEYYLFSEIDTIYPIVEQKGYHESHPFSKWGAVRREAMQILSEMGCNIKYGHAEVGNIIHDGTEMVQHEIEFLPVPVEDAADQLVLAKWVVREIAYKYDLEVSYAPKNIVGHAGSGLHIHSRLVKDDKSVMTENNTLGDAAKKLIAGYLMMAPALTAFGNTVPTSFLRLVPHQEAPTSICWGDRNRSVLVRVPLGWLGVDDMIYTANPLEPKVEANGEDNQTVELRSPDGSANVHQLLAGMTVAAIYGLENKKSLEVADELYVKEDVTKLKNLSQLPASCFEAADELLKMKDIFEQYNIFPHGMIDQLAADLKKHDDKDLSEKLYGDAVALQKLVNEFLHCG